MAQTRMPEVGEVAPEVDAETADGSRFKLSEHLGSWVVVYFFPRANTPG